MIAALAVLALALGFALGWLAHRRVSLHYKQRWLDALKALQDKQLESADLQTPIVPGMDIHQALHEAGAKQVQISGSGSKSIQAGRSVFVPGKWALDERKVGKDMDTAEFWAVRMGFDDVKLGSAPTGYRGIYCMQRADAEQAVRDMNSQVRS